MKPSENIEKIVDDLREKNPFAYPYDTDINIALVHISAIQQYLDEQWEKNKTPEQGQYDQIK